MKSKKIKVKQKLLEYLELSQFTFKTILCNNSKFQKLFPQKSYLKEMVELNYCYTPHVWKSQGILL